MKFFIAVTRCDTIYIIEDWYQGSDAQGPPLPFPRINDVTPDVTIKQNAGGKGGKERGGFDAQFLTVSVK